MTLPSVEPGALQFIAPSKPSPKTQPKQIDIQRLKLRNWRIDGSPCLAQCWPVARKGMGMNNAPQNFAHPGVRVGFIYRRYGSYRISCRITYRIGAEQHGLRHE